MIIHRYKHDEIVHSSLDPLQDVLSWVKGLQSKEYFTEIVKSLHALSLSRTSTLHERISACCAHISTACSYLDQALNGPENVSFLPLYYAFLNLAEVYVILGPYGHLLPNQRRHGVSYDPTGQGKDLLKESIKWWKEGAIPLFYRTITGHALRDGIPMQMSQMYPYILDISVEYMRATRKHSLLRPALLKATEKAGYWQIECELVGLKQYSPHADDRKYLPTIKGLRRAKGSKTLFVSRRFKNVKEEPPIDSLRSTLSTFLLYTSSAKPPELPENFQSGYPSFLPVSDKSWLPFEELPILLSFFHLSSVVRYHPEFHCRLMESKYWPMLLVLKRQATYRFLLLFFSFVMQQSTYIETY